MTAKIIKLLNRLNSRFSQALGGFKSALKIRLIILLAHVMNLFEGADQRKRSFTKLKTAHKGDIVLNLMGYIGLSSTSGGYQKELDSVAEIFEEADLSLASVRCTAKGKQNLSKLKKRMRKYGICNVAEQNNYIRSQMFHTASGNFAVISYKRYAAESRTKHNRLELAREMYRLKRAGAEYIIVYVDNRISAAIKSKDKKLYRSLIKLGADYVMGVYPNACDAGVTYMRKDRSIARATYSAGTFLTGSADLPDERVILRLKLRRVNGKMQAYQEGFYPLKHTAEGELKVLMGQDLTREDVASLANLEQNMSRLHRVDRILTIGKIVEVIGTKLPKEYAWIEDFAVNKIAAIPGGRMADDVFFRWQPWTEPNDASTYKRRKRAGIRIAKRMAKHLMFIVTYKDLNLKCPHVVVEDTLMAHINTCHYLRSQIDTRCIAITGSIGKTSTKDMLAEVMKMHYNTVKSSKNENTQTKISLSVQRIHSDCEVYIQEMGGGRPGGAARHSSMVMPEAAVITNIGDAHIGNFEGNQLLLMKNKLEITHGMVEGGTLYLNGDDPLLITARPDCNTVFYAVNNKDADYYAEEVEEDATSTSFVIVHGDHRVKARVNVLGEHNVLNAVCCYAIGKQFGIPEKEIIAGLLNFKPSGIRQNLVKECGINLYLDCYNASSGSVVSSLKTLSLIPKAENGKRVAMLGDITGLGDLAEETHKEMAQTVLENPADLHIFMGKNTKFAYDIVKENGLPALYVNNTKDLVQTLRENVHRGDVLMAKGSSKMKLEYAIDCAFGTRFYDQVLLDEHAYYRTEVDGVVYNLFASHATAVTAKAGTENLHIKRNLGGVTTVNIGSAFKGGAMHSVSLPNTVQHIGVAAFRDCKNLEKVTGTSGLKFIGREAFKDCTALQSIELPEGLLHIGSMAFSGCKALKSLTIPESVSQIGKDAFADCGKMKLYCKAGSHAAAVLKKQHIPYTVSK